MLLEGFPGADDAVLCISELASNSVLHSHSGRTGGTFTVRIEVRDGRYVHVEVKDGGGPWQEPMARDDDRLHGLQVISELADTCGREGDGATGWVTWARLGWPSTNDHLPPHGMVSDTQLVRLDVGGWISGPCLDAAALATPLDGLAEPGWAWPAGECQRPAK
jgi:serine/threonine-protein kinase RsbW